MDKLTNVLVGSKTYKLTEKIDFELQNKRLIVTLKHPCANMQTNEAAFEAWCLVLKENNKSIKDIELRVLIDDIELCKNNGHFKRLLWRIHNFRNLFAWFHVEKSLLAKVNSFVNDFKDIRINQPSVSRPKVTNSKGERYVEDLFNNQYANVLCSVSGCNKLLNQLPVGIFKNNVSKNTSIFTGGASAIDLIGIKDPNEIHLFELKKGKNSSLGIISEFLFYAFILREVFITGEIKYDFMKDKDFKIKDFNILNDYIYKNNNYIRGHLLFEKVHPLISKGFVDTLNSALKASNISLDRIAYKFEETTLTISNVHII